VTKLLVLSLLGLPLSEKQIPQVVEKLESGVKGKGSFGAGRYAPKAGALPGCATPRLNSFYTTSEAHPPEKRNGLPLEDR
jgi:hypothetical protein